MKNASIERKKLSLHQTMNELKVLAKNNNLEWEDELDIDYSEEVEFILWLRWWRLLCHIEKEYPYTIRFRLIGSKDYKRVKPYKFIEAAKEALLH